MSDEDWGSPAPKWLRDADTYNGWYVRFRPEDFDNFAAPPDDPQPYPGHRNQRQGPDGVRGYAWIP